MDGWNKLKFAQSLYSTQPLWGTASYHCHRFKSSSKPESYDNFRDVFSGAQRHNIPCSSTLIHAFPFSPSGIQIHLAASVITKPCQASALPVSSWSRQGGAREWAFPVWPPIQLCYVQVVTLCKFQTLFHPKKGQPRTAVRLKWLMCGKVPVNGAATWWVYNKREHPFLQAPRGHYFSVSCSAHHSQYVHAFPHQNVLKSLTVGTVALFIPRLCHPTGAQGARLNKTSDKFTQSNFFNFYLTPPNYLSLSYSLP